MHQPREDYLPKVSALELLLGLPDGTLSQLLGPPKPEGRRVDGEFTHALRSGIEARGISVRQFAAETGIPAKTVGYWLRGGHPGPKHRGSVGIIEEALRLPAGSLGELLPSLRCSFLQYSVDLTPRQQEEWERLLNHKTTLDEADENRRPFDHWRKKKDGSCPSGEMFYRLVRQFYGYLALPADAADPLQRGLGLDSESLSLLNLANREHVQSFVRFLSKRAGGYNSQTEHVIQFARSLLRPGTGFLHQGVEVDWRAFPINNV